MSESTFKKQQERKIAKYSRQLCNRFTLRDIPSRLSIERRLKNRSYRTTDPKKVDEQLNKLCEKMLLNNQLLKSETLKR